MPTPADQVHKEECAFTFTGPMGEDGLNVSLQSFIGVGPKHLQTFSDKRGENLFVNIKKRKRPVEENTADPSEAKTTSDDVYVALLDANDDWPLRVNDALDGASIGEGESAPGGD